MLLLSGAKESGLFLKTPSLPSAQMPNSHRHVTTKKEIDVLRVTSNVHEKILFSTHFVLLLLSPFPLFLPAPLLLSVLCTTLWFAELGFNPGKGLR